MSIPSRPTAGTRLLEQGYQEEQTTDAADGDEHDHAQWRAGLGEAQAQRCQLGERGPVQKGELAQQSQHCAHCQGMKLHGRSSGKWGVLRVICRNGKAAGTWRRGSARIACVGRCRCGLSGSEGPRVDAGELGAHQQDLC